MLGRLEGLKEIDKKKREEENQERIVVEGFGKVAVEQGCEGSGGSAAGTKEAAVLVDGAKRIEEEAVRRVTIEHGRRGEQEQGDCREGFAGVWHSSQWDGSFSGSGMLIGEDPSSGRGSPPGVVAPGSLLVRAGSSVAGTLLEGVDAVEMILEVETTEEEGHDGVEAEADRFGTVEVLFQ